MNIEDLRWKVIEVGQKNRDARTIEDVLPDLDIENKLDDIMGNDRVFRLQVLRDSSADYKFYDALAMWLGQREYWKDETNNWLVKVAERYLREFKGGEKNEKQT